MINSNTMKKIHFIYKTINLINNRYYIGMHSTYNIKDGYIGSGKRLKSEIIKYGKENFKTEILEYLPNRKALAKREKEIVNESLLKDPSCLNLKEGGFGGFCNEEHMLKFLKSSIHTRLSNPNAPAHVKLKKLYLNPYWKFLKNKKTSAGLKAVNFDHATFKGKKHSQKTKKQISESNKGKGVGKENSQFGTCWITDGKQNKKIKKTDTVPIGWRLGRVI